MNLRKMQYFVDAVELENFSMVAKKNYISQTAISQQIMAIENEVGTQLFERLDKVQPFCLEYFVNHWISAYLELYSGAGHALVQLRMMIMDDAEISQHFSGLENKYFLKIGEILGRNGNTQNNRSEKVYISCVLVDSLRQEKSAFTHNRLDFEALKQQVAKTVVRLLSE